MYPCAVSYVCSLARLKMVRPRPVYLWKILQEFVFKLWASCLCLLSNTMSGLMPRPEGSSTDRDRLVRVCTCKDGLFNFFVIYGGCSAPIHIQTPTRPVGTLPSINLQYSHAHLSYGRVLTTLIGRGRYLWKCRWPHNPSRVVNPTSVPINDGWASGWVV